MRHQEVIGIGIVNPYGDLWSTEVYDTPEAAIRALRSFWNGISAFDETKWRLTPVRLTVTPPFPAERWKLSDYTAREASGPSNSPRGENV